MVIVSKHVLVACYTGNNSSFMDTFLNVGGDCIFVQTFSIKYYIEILFDFCRQFLNELQGVNFV